MIGGCGYRKKTAFKGARDDPQTERGFTIPAQHISFAAIFIFHLLSRVYLQGDFLPFV
jgi:hypothetical protein